MGNLRALVPSTKDDAKVEHALCAMCSLRYKKEDGHTTDVCRNRLHTQLRNEKRLHAETRKTLYRITDSLEPLVEIVNSLPTVGDREE